MSMDKGVILYRSKYGAAKKYANWLKELTRYDCIEASKGNIDSVMRYDVDVYKRQQERLPRSIND